MVIIRPMGLGKRAQLASGTEIAEDERPRLSGRLLFRSPLSIIIIIIIIITILSNEVHHYILVVSGGAPEPSSSTVQLRVKLCTYR